MSRDVRKTYTGYQRYILAEILTDDELTLLDTMYTNAKIKRTIKLAKDQAISISTTIDIDKIAKRQ